MSNLNLIVLRCADIERSREFYETFGMTFSKHAHGSGPEHYASETDALVFELYPASPGAAIEMTALGFHVGDLDQVSSLLQEKGFAPGAQKSTAWGRTFVVRDPDGRRVEIKS